MAIKSKMLRKILTLRGLKENKKSIKTVCPEGIGASESNEALYLSIKNFIHS